MGNRRLYVGDLAASVTEQELEELFGQIGNVQKVEIISRPPQRPFAFIMMETREMAQLGIARFNNYAFAGSRLIVYSVPQRNSKHRTVP